MSWARWKRLMSVAPCDDGTQLAGWLTLPRLHSTLAHPQRQRTDAAPPGWVCYWPEPDGEESSPFADHCSGCRTRLEHALDPESGLNYLSSQTVSSGAIQQRTLQRHSRSPAGDARGWVRGGGCCPGAGAAARGLAGGGRGWKAGGGESSACWGDPAAGPPGRDGPDPRPA